MESDRGRLYPLERFADALGDRVLLAVPVADGDAVLDRLRRAGDVLLLERQHRLQEQKDAIPNRMVH